MLELVCLRVLALTVCRRPGASREQGDLGWRQQPVEVWRLSSPPLGALAQLQVYSALIQPTSFLQVQAELVGRQPSLTVARVC